MGRSPYELVFGIKPKRTIMFVLLSTKDYFGNCNTSQTSPCHFFSKYTHSDHLGHHPQVKNLSKETFAH